MREYPWHLRLPTHEHHQWFKNLLDLHNLTLSWLKDEQAERPYFVFPKGISPAVQENAWMLETLVDVGLDQILDDSTPSDTLGRLEHAIWAGQCWAINHLQNKGTVLDQSSWKAGKANAESRWKEFSRIGKSNLREILLSLNDSPFSGYPMADGFLVKRSVDQEIIIELRNCPHQSRYTESKSVADKLCRQHSQWMKGFAQALNPAVNIEHVVQLPRCTQRWFLG